MKHRGVFVAVLSAITVIASVALVTYGMNPIVASVVMVAGLGIFGVFLPSRLSSRKQDNIQQDLKQTCKPLLKHYRRSHSVQRLIDEYRAWDKGDHPDDVRVLFSQNVVSILLKEGRYDEAREFLASGLAAAKRRHLAKDYQQFIDVCEKNMRDGGAA